MKFLGHLSPRQTAHHWPPEVGLVRCAIQRMNVAVFAGMECFPRNRCESTRLRVGDHQLQ